MEHMHKGLNVLKWELIVWPKILQMPQYLPAQFVSTTPKVLDYNEKKKSSLGVVVHGLDWQKEKEYYVGILLFFHEYLTTGLNNVMTLLNALHTALRKFSQTYRVTPTSC